MSEDLGSGTTSIPEHGTLAEAHPDAVLRFCEDTHFSGTLSFESERGKGLLPILNGVPEVLDDATMEIALDEFLSLSSGTYTLRQVLPNLEGATRDGDRALHGTLHAGSVPELMRYCESAGITGSLHLARGDEHCEARYARGELESIVVDREQDQNLERVFEWETGTFRVAALPLFAPPTPQPAAEPEPQLLRTLEIALAEIMDQRSRRESVHPTSSPFRSPSLRSLPGASFGLEPSAGSKPPSALRAPTRPLGRRSIASSAPSGPDTTVKVILVARPLAPDTGATRHAEAPLAREEVQLDLATASHPESTEEAAPERVPEAVDAPIDPADPSAPPEATATSSEAAAPTVTEDAPSEPALPASTESRGRPDFDEEPFTVWTGIFATVSVTATCVALWMLYSLVR